MVSKGKRRKIKAEKRRKIATEKNRKIATEKRNIVIYIIFIVLYLKDLEFVETLLLFNFDHGNDVLSISFWFAVLGFGRSTFFSIEKIKGTESSKAWNKIFLFFFLILLFIVVSSFIADVLIDYDSEFSTTVVANSEWIYHLKVHIIDNFTLGGFKYYFHIVVCSFSFVVKAIFVDGT